MNSEKVFVSRIKMEMLSLKLSLFEDYTEKGYENTKLNVMDFVVVMPVFFVVLLGLILSFLSGNIALFVLVGTISLLAIVAALFILYCVHYDRKENKFIL